MLCGRLLSIARVDVAHNRSELLQITFHVEPRLISILENDTKAKLVRDVNLMFSTCSGMRGRRARGEISRDTKVSEITRFQGIYVEKERYVTLHNLLNSFELQKDGIG